MGQEGDDVVLGLALDLVDPGDVEGLPPSSQIVLAASFGITPSFGLGVAGMGLDLEPDRNLVSGAQMATMSGRE